MTKRKTQAKELTPERLQKLCESFELVDISLARGLFSQNLRDGELPSNLQSSYNLDPSYDKSSKLLTVAVTLIITGAYGEMPKDIDADIPLRISAIFHLYYQAEKQVRIPKSELLDFSRHLSRTHVWPYWREYVQNVTTRMGMPALTIPLLRGVTLGKLRKAKKKLAKSKKKTQGK